MSRIMKSLRVVGFLTAALALGLLPACQPESGKPKVAFVTNNPESFWTIAEAGAIKSAEKENVELLFRRPDKGDPAVQRTAIDGAVNQGAKAVAVSVIDPKNQADYIDKVAEKVPFLCVDNDAPQTKRLCYIGTDNYEGGKAVGRLVKEALPDGGKIAVFVGDLAPLNARQRLQGVIDELAGSKIEKVKDGETYGKYKLFRTYTDQPEGAQKAKQNAVAALESEDLRDEPNVCLIGLWAYNPPKILSAVTDKKKLGKVKIVGFDEDPETLQGIADGNILGTVVQNPYQFGFQSVKMMAALARGDKSILPADGMYPIDFRIITKDGGKDYPETVHGEKTSIPVKEFRQQLDELLGKKA
jgi:ribose transport system substrate-binding protein